MSHIRASRKLLLIASGMAALFLLDIRAASGSGAARVSAHVEQLAAELPWLSVGDVVYDRVPRPRSGPDADRVAAILAKLADVESEGSPSSATTTRAAAATTAPATVRAAAGDQRPFGYPRVPAIVADPGNVRPLLDHANPKVRTLAIALLLKLERLDVMADIAALVDDNAETFPVPGMISSLAGVAPPNPWPMKKQTVGDFARAATDRYVHASAYLDELRRGNRLPRDGASLARVFREMASTRDAFTNTATLRVAMERATGGTSPVPDERQERVRNVLMTVNSVPLPRRFFVAHALDAQRLSGDRYAPTYLLDMARQVPHAVRIAVLNGERPADDPDLQRGTGWKYFLQNAPHLLRASDVEFLLRLNDRTKAHGPRGYATALYAIAAARLVPARAEEILIPVLDDRSAKGSSWENADAAAAVLAELGGDDGVRHALDWFFSIQPQPGTYGGGREAILGQLQLSSPERFRRFVARVVRDERLTTLGPASTRMLVRAVQGYSGLPIVDEEQIGDSYGVDEAQRDRRPSYLANWHRRLRDTIDDWDASP